MSEKIHVGTLPTIGVQVSVMDGKVTAQVSLHDLAVSLRALAADCDQREESGDYVPASLTLEAIADGLEDWRREAIGSWMNRNSS